MMVSREKAPAGARAPVAARAAAPAPAAQDRVLLRTLMHAMYWVDDALQAQMKRQAAFTLPRAQSMIMTCLTEGIVNPIELARHLKVSKQAIRQALRPMIETGLVTVAPDPSDRRRRIVQVTEYGLAMRDIARRSLASIEAELARRIGRDRVEALHEILNADWGPPPEDL